MGMYIKGVYLLAFFGHCEKSEYSSVTISSKMKCIYFILCTKD